MGSLSSSIFENISVIRDGISLVTNTARSEINTQNQAREQQLALRQLQDQQRLNQKQAAQDAALERERIAVQAQAAEEDRQRALRRAVSRQRANFAGSGISSANGSAQAVLLGLFDESEEELAQRERLDNLRNRSIDLGVSQNRSLNVLQATQLKERQKLNNLSPIVDRAENALNFGLGAFEIYEKATRG